MTRGSIVVDARMEAAFKPQLAATIELAKGHAKQLQFPLLASPKYDGIRVLHPTPGLGLVTRKLKQVPNDYLREFYQKMACLGFDGEMIVGNPTAEDCFNRSQSVVMSKTHADEKLARFYVFDICTPGYASVSFEERLRLLRQKAKGLFGVIVVPQQWVSNLNAATDYEEHLVLEGYEGMMLRKPTAPYKWGRSTMNDQYLMKWKRFEDSEAEVLGVYEQQENTNEAKRDELGYTKRSSHKDGKVGKGTFGGFHMRDVKSGVEFDCGTGRGLTLEARDLIWKNRKAMVGQIWKYRFQPTGVKEKPRFPVLIGPRDRRDM